MASVELGVILTARPHPRLQVVAGEPPLALQTICGVSLIKRQIDALYRAGIKKCVVVLDGNNERIRQTVETDSSIHMDIQWVVSQAWKMGEGAALASAKEFLTGPFVLLREGHYYDAATVKRFVEQPLGENEALLLVDRNLNDLMDLRVANKIRVMGHRIQEIGEKVKEPEGVDTGLYLCRHPFAQPSLNAAINHWIKEGKVSWTDIQNGFWFDLDTPGNRAHAENRLLASMRKATDGFVSRNLNRSISLRISRILMNTPVTGNHVTYASLILGVIAAAFFAGGTFWSVLVGALLFQLLSILDGCDGELAKLKLQDSKKGQFLDTVIDQATYVAFLIGVTIGYYRANPQGYVLVLGLLMVANFGIGIAILSHFSRRVGNWSFVAANQAFFPKNEPSSSGTVKTFLHAGFAHLKFAIRRDFFAFATLIAAIFNGLAVIFWVAFVATTLYAVGSVLGRPAPQTAN